MIVKTFRAPTMEEALAKVKATLGDSALIIETRKVAPRGLFGFFRKPLVEVVVGIDDPLAPTARKPSEPRQGDWTGEVANLRTLEHEIDQIKGALREISKTQAAAARPAPPPIAAPAPSPSPRVSGEPASAHDMPAAPKPDVPALYRDLPPLLVERGVDPSTAATLVAACQAERQRAHDNRRPIYHLRAVLKQRFRTVAEPPATPGTGPRVVALVGPPGTGKTTMLAKLASRLALGRGDKIALASADFFRVGAAEQLGAYAEILGAPFHPIAGPDEVPAAIEAAATAQWLLVDTPGLPHHDTEHLAELAQWLGAFPTIERHLVLSATTDRATALASLDTWRTVGFDRVAFAKLDEARRHGVLLAAAEAANTPVSYLGTGQDVARDLEVAEPGRLADFVLGNALNEPASKSTS